MNWNRFGNTGSSNREPPSVRGYSVAFATSTNFPVSTCYRPRHAMLFYFALATFATAATHAYLYRRLVAASGWPASARRGAGALLAANVLILPGVLVLCLRARAAWAAWAVPLGRVAFIDEGFCLLLVAALAGRDVVWAAARAAGSLRRGRPAAPDLQRRRALQILRATGIAAAGVAAGATGIAHAQAVAVAELDRVRLRIARLHAGLRGLRIAQISDLHVGPTLRGDTVAAIVARVNAAAPDLVVITGDLVDGYVDQLAGEVAALRDLRAPLGCFFVTGNHEYFYRAREWVEQLRALGCTVLLNAHHVLERGGGRLLVAGVCDESGASHPDGHPHDLEGAVAAAPPVDARVLLAHRPDCAPRAAALGFDAQLSGHLHGGQFFPITTLLRATSRYVAGLYDVDGMQLYVSRGAGYWGPSLRLGAPQEVTIFELVEQGGSPA
jgi:predicted MPP superfamily phosphohydrolase